MIESEVIDVRCGEPHITAEQIMDVNIGTYGSEDYVLSTGNKMKAELITNNSVRVFDGVMVYGGVRDAVPVNKYYDITIDNGAQGKNRNDIIVRRFTREEGTSGIGSSSFAVVKGTPVDGTAEDPAIDSTDLRGGALTHDMPLHRVRIEGLNIVAVEPMFNVLCDAAELKEMVAELNSNKFEIVTNENGIAKKYNNGLVEQFGRSVCVNANNLVAQSNYSLPVPVIFNKTHSVVTSKNSMGNSASSINAVSFGMLNSDGSQITIGLHDENGDCNKYTDDERTIAWYVIGFWK